MGRKLGYKHDEKTKEKMSLSRKGVPKSVETRERIRKANLGKKLSLETRLKMKNAQFGEKSPNWKGGITKIEDRIRASCEYRIWRDAVLKRDNHTCIWCNKREKSLHVDHIKQFAYFPELRFEISNGRVLCFDCHKKTNTYSHRQHQTLKYVNH